MAYEYDTTVCREEVKKIRDRPKFCVKVNKYFQSDETQEGEENWTEVFFNMEKASKLNDAIVTICNLLEFEHDHLSFVDAGRIITHAQNEYACIKYGENHLKLASALSLVDL